ncbi:hypothetical protein POSPLADRAFT_1150078 [Postia placenta MAD-698-R-SB12]|uniref:Up-regulated during septation protein 1 domain-containing protein n=1 Tax=Postia placenta MAD-698-R-SB12 TaxID=670580 RepID=A0A1X6MT96_9APHY|nr:hypothetical protein POSPLADRAFT_1150078 [Postia placenta MAD-698-R-SB12]OSX59393.1 hypothetical protein POSPLADRAFT_1150078 [Postia placenta MAD-698-R-SB12]
MNGVRRFLTGGGTPTSSTFPQSPPSPPSQYATITPSPPKSTAPLAISAKPSWPPSPLQSPTELSPVTSPKVTTAALFLRKDRQKPLPSASEDTQGNASFHSPQSSRESNGVGSPARGQASVQMSSPVAGPSSPRPLPSRVSELSRKLVERPGVTTLDLKRNSEMGSTRDDLLIDLLASEAIVDSRGCEILTSEEVEELKKEHQVLSSRLVAASKKLALETKIRDAALSLSKANASFKNVSKQTSEQLDTASRKVELAQKELWRISERANEVQRKLLEHRAGVLSHSENCAVRRGLHLQMSPTPSSATSITTSSSRGRFEHFVAGHSDSIVPQVPRAPPTIAEVSVLEEKLKAATAALEAATAKQAEMVRDLSLLKLEKDQVETTLGMDLQTAEDTISMLEQEASKVGEVETRLQELEAERDAWEADRAELEERRREVDTLERRLEVLEEQSGEAAEMSSVFAREREERLGRLAVLESELAEERADRAEERQAWAAERAALADGASGRTELDAGVDALSELIQTHGILLVSRDSSIVGLVASVGRHLEDLRAKIDAHTRAEEEWAVLRAKLEGDIRAGLDKREALFEEVEEARRTRDEARVQARELETQLRVAQMAVASLQASQAPVEYTGDAAQMVALLRPIWAVLPSPEARASKLGARNFRAGSPIMPGSPTPGRNNSSLSEMDVRSLKTLYDPRAMPPPSLAAFTVEAFVARVQALIADDRALIERLIRFAQAHDLLKKNAERAQKLAQESNGALETYQKQVKMLEDRNLTMISKMAQLLTSSHSEDEAQYLQEQVDRITAEKLEIETQAAEQAETCRQLTDANNTLSARALTLASDAADAGDSVRKQMEVQLAECNTALERAKEEIEAMRSSQQTQQMALLEELNSMQTENASLRAQLRKK